MFSVKLQHESATGIHISSPFWISLSSPSPTDPSRLIQSPCLSILRHIPSSQSYGFSSCHVMTNLDSILKSRDITLLTNVCLVKAMVFPVVMYGCESWTIRKAEHSSILAWRILWTEEPSGLQSTGSRRVRQDWVTDTFTSRSLRANHAGNRLHTLPRRLLCAHCTAGPPSENSTISFTGYKKIAF